MTIQNALEKKLTRLKAEYPDGELPIKARHALDLLKDITALLVAQEKQIQAIDPHLRGG